MLIRLFPYTTLPDCSASILETYTSVPRPSHDGQSYSISVLLHASEQSVFPLPCCAWPSDLNILTIHANIPIMREAQFGVGQLSPSPPTAGLHTTTIKMAPELRRPWSEPGLEGAHTRYQIMEPMHVPVKLSLMQTPCEVEHPLCRVGVIVLTRTRVLGQKIGHDLSTLPHVCVTRDLPDVWITLSRGGVRPPGSMSNRMAISRISPIPVVPFFGRKVAVSLGIVSIKVWVLRVYPRRVSTAAKVAEFQHGIIGKMCRKRLAEKDIVQLEILMHHDSSKYTRVHIFHLFTCFGELLHEIP